MQQGLLVPGGMIIERQENVTEAVLEAFKQTLLRAKSIAISSS